MLVVPVVAGAILAARAETLRWWVIPLAILVLAGYLTFYSTTTVLKARPTRRRALLTPVVVHGTVAAVAGALVLALGGWPLLWWLPIYLPVLLVALWLASARKERSIASGGLTILAASLMVLVIRFITPMVIWQTWDVGTAGDVAIAAVIFGYFFGTVFHVKSLIRERGQRRSRWRSLVWHGLCIVAAAGVAAAGVIGWWWTIFFVITFARSFWFTHRALHGQVDKPLVIGMTEMAISALAIIGVALP